MGLDAFLGFRAVHHHAGRWLRGVDGRAEGGRPLSASGAHPAAPIGVFDSGVGGLTVLRAIHARLPDESTIYLGDTARVPYGSKSPDTVRRYAGEAARFLSGCGVKAIVIACNTATAHARRELVEASDFPVIGVVEPGAGAAARRSASGRIGVIGTRGTVESRTYEEAILRVRPDAEVFSQPCPLFVALAEETWVSGPVAELTAREYLAPLLAHRIDTLLLGCTHYPLLAPLIADVVGDGVALVDSAHATAEETARQLGGAGLRAESGRLQAPDHRYCVTDDEDRFAEIAERFLGAPTAGVERVMLGDEFRPGVAQPAVEPS